GRHKQRTLRAVIGVHMTVRRQSRTVPDTGFSGRAGDRAELRCVPSKLRLHPSRSVQNGREPRVAGHIDEWRHIGKPPGQIAEVADQMLDGRPMIAERLLKTDITLTTPLPNMPGNAQAHATTHGDHRVVERMRPRIDFDEIVSILLESYDAIR